MFDYFEQFNNLDPKIKEKVSNPFVVGTIESLEKKYGIDLASVVMLVMVKGILINDLAIHLSDQFSLSEEVAKSLATDLKEKVFLGVADYLGMDLSQLFVTKIEESKKEVTKDEVPAPTPVPVSAPVVDEYSQEIDNAIRATIIEMNLDLSLDLAEKLNSALKLYWRGVRNKIDTRALLIKPVKDGGFSLGDPVIDALLNALDKKKNTISDKKQAAIKKPSSGILEKIGQLAKNSARYESDYNLASLLDTKHELNSGIDLSHEIAPVPVVPALPKIEKKPDISSVMEEVKEIPKPVVAPVIPTPVVMPVIPVVPVVPVQPVVAPAAAPVRPVENKVKPRVEDIKPIRIMNPIDELRYMDLINFRRISKDVNDITKKIKSRIKLLEGEDYEKGLAGVTAWRQSPVNKLYLKIINSSMSEDQTIPQIIEGLKAKKQDYLSLAEVEAIISLNSELKF
ncbi:MAG: hypothetical protein WCJ57_03095 [Candidatus Falkowbacteria bacterium]